MRDEILKEIESIQPFDSLENETIVDVTAWIKSGAELCRLEKPAVPAKHLVSYFVVIDGDYVLLVDHINAEKWLPTGGHVEAGEHPRDAAIREVFEELQLRAEFIRKEPILLTSTETVGKTAGHIDVSLWYALNGDRSAKLTIDKGEFHEARWFHRDLIPKNTDPHLGRFVDKFFG